MTDNDYDPLALDLPSDDLFADVDPFTDIATETSREFPRSIAHPREARRQFIANLKRDNLEALLPAMPPPEIDVHILASGAGREGGLGSTLAPTGFDFGSFALHAIGNWLGHGAKVHLSSWVLNQDHVSQLLGMLDSGMIAELTVFSDPFFKKRHTASIANSLILGMQRHTPRARFLAFKNHTKLLCIANADSTRFVSVQGSANFTAVARVENFVLSTAREVYDFYINSFFKEMLK